MQMPAELSKAMTLKGYFDKEDVRTKFKEMLGKKAQGFITSVLQIAASNDDLRNADPMSIYNAACTAATLDLPINANLGFAWIVPYNISYQDDKGLWKKRQVAQFQIGYKGLVQLAQRTGQYLRMNVVEVYENQYRSFNFLTEELDADFDVEGEGRVVGYCAYFKLLNGFEKVVYWSVKRVSAHGLKYSKSYNSEKGLWKTDFPAMSLKTVLKNTLSKWGILSIEMQKALIVDQAVINDEDAIDVDYPDNDKATLENNQSDKERERIEFLIIDYGERDAELQEYEALQTQIGDKYPDLVLTIQNTIEALKSA